MLIMRVEVPFCDRSVRKYVSVGFEHLSLHLGTLARDGWARALDPNCWEFSGFRLLSKFDGVLFDCWQHYAKRRC